MLNYLDDRIENIQAELLCIGCILIDPSLIHIAELSDSDFSDPLNKRIYSHLRRLASKGKVIDPLILMDDYRSRHPNAANRIVEILQNTHSTTNFKAYADVVREKAVSRRLVDTARQIEEIARNGGIIDEQLGAAQRLVFSINQRHGKDVTDAKVFTSMLVDHLDRVASQKGELGLMSGFKSVDNRVRGYRSGDLVIVAGRPSMGKTTYALNIATKAALKGKKVMIFSLEMSLVQITSKIVASISGIPINKFMDGSAINEDRFVAATSLIQDTGLKIDDTAGLSIDQLSSRARRAAANGGLDLIMVDYIGLMAGETDSRTENVSRITSGLKRLARELDVPIIALSQLNRGVELRENKRPQLADLRDSGTVEQDADIVQFLFRPEYYNREDPSLQGIAEVITAKFRLGQCGTDHLIFNGELSRFENPPPSLSLVVNEPI